MPDKETETLALQNGIKVVNTSTNASIGEYFLRAIKESKGDVITFLDDDDMFAKNKLSIVDSLFSLNPKLSYHRNSAFQVRNHNKFFELRKIAIKSQRNGLKFLDSVQALKSGIWSLQWTMSCISIRKSIFYGYENIIKDITAAPDLTSFYLTVSRAGIFCSDSRHLTVQRLHSESAMAIKGKNNDYVREYESLGRLYKNLSSQLVRSDLEKNLIRIRLLAVINGAPMKRNEIEGHFKRYLKLGIKNWRDTIVLSWMTIFLTFNLLTKDKALSIMSFLYSKISSF